ncbi:hypothetical protein I6F14_11865 [Bradyrhizobium sp. IC3069]|uniref:hypothetical protein n=1 Tax=Bradyrhizobium TaxID=374 RepID=UPI001CD68FC6|nr:MULTISPECIES: hypothetical protein [unclassified Bradyrhizobium]MCA1361529.1 hypothetical protein [Bradyrhizobium sp. IC4059]MCA1510906.1 hypothetical protein [Bradyrhizobium sp. NBAIM01]MCA1518674.1 hypothetical protein [Bradyrhizobium sp. IC3069]
MKFFTGCVAAAVLALGASAGQAQVPASGIARGAVIAVSDFDGPYAPPEAAPPPRYGYGYEERGPALALLPPTEVYAVLRENGFSPLGIPRLRGGVYTIAVIDRNGDDGRLVIDARDGRIIRFMPAPDAYGMAPAYDERAVAPYGPQTALPPTVVRGGPPRPPASIPHVASRAVPLPKAAPRRAEPPVVVAKPAEPAAQAAQAQPAQQAAVVQAKPTEAAPQATAPTVGQVRPAPTILPTQEMPAALGLD